MPLQVQSAIGLLIIPLIAFLLRERSRTLAWKPALRIVVVGIAIQVGIAATMLAVPATRAVFAAIGDGVAALQTATAAGTQLVFGYLAGGPAPFEITNPQNAFVAAFQAFPLILMISAIASLLFYWGVLQRVVHVLAILLSRSLGVSGPTATGAAANIFVGMIEAPLFIRPYLRNMDRGSLFALMTVGLATIAGTVLVLYASILTDVVPDAAGHLIVASVISAPAALMLAQLMIPPGPGAPEAEEIEESTGEAEARPTSAIDAITSGTQDGVVLLTGVISTLLVFVALVALTDQILASISGPLDLSLQKIGGWIFAPVAWLIGIPWSEAGAAGGLLGIKTVTNELVAFITMAGEPDALSERSRLIMTYALAGFANFGSVGIMIGGLAALMPDRRPEIVELGLKSLVSGTLATLMTGAVIGLLV
ncbi:MAG: nucleoside transporter C-terminal domain-containing protein [Pseudomonadota bacterium]